MAKAKFTKYGDDEFVLRMDRENAFRLLTAIGKYWSNDPVLKDDEDKNVHETMRSTLRGLLSDKEFNEERRDSSVNIDVIVPVPTLYIHPWKV